MVLWCVVLFCHDVITNVFTAHKTIYGLNNTIATGMNVPHFVINPHGEV